MGNHRSMAAIEKRIAEMAAERKRALAVAELDDANQKVLFCVCGWNDWANAVCLLWGWHSVLVMRVETCRGCGLQRRQKLSVCEEL